MAEEMQKQGFDFLVTHRDRKTGAITHKNPYIMRVIASPEGGKTKIFERPVGSGNIWNAKGEPIGRWVNNSFKKGEAHIEFIAPKTEDQKLKESLLSQQARIAELEKELLSVKAEENKSGKKAKNADVE